MTRTLAQLTLPLTLAPLLGAALACTSPRTDVDAATGGLAQPRLRVEDSAAWSRHIAPAGDELAFESVGWIPDFGQGLVAADEAQRPLFFWAMNGHPLGCT
ncbi:MAG: hypothetical protein DRQ55_05565 [Planctomycetota bacterium]|nr:MAG: hypothetical protein DRQ55_05565 [Planctomycetota bacterium]